MKIFFLLFSMLTIFTCQFSIFTFKITCILQEVLKKVKTFSLRQNKTFSKIRPFLQLSELQGSGAILMLIFIKTLSRSSHQMCSLRKGALRNFTTFTGKHLCQSLFFNKVAGLGSATLLKKRLWHRCFPGNFAKFLRTLFLQNTSGRLFLSVLQCYKKVILKSIKTKPDQVFNIPITKVSCRNKVWIKSLQWSRISVHLSRLCESYLWLRPEDWNFNPFFPSLL